jgi:hypothetical protein
MFALKTGRLVTRDQFHVLPMPDNVIAHLNHLADLEGISGSEAEHDKHDQLVDVTENTAAVAPEPTFMPVENRTVEPFPTARESTVAPITGGNDDDTGVGEPSQWNPPRRSERIRAQVEAAAEARAHDARVMYVDSKDRHSVDQDRVWMDSDFTLTMSVRAAIRERGEEAAPVIRAELQQRLDKRVWHAVDHQTLTPIQRKSITRFTMFLKDKYTASGAFEKFKARLVAGGDQQDKTLYDNLSSPTAATSSVLAVAAIAAAEGRSVVGLDIGGAFLNADMPATGVKVHMRLDRIMTTFLLDLDPI